MDLGRRAAPGTYAERKVVRGGLVMLAAGTAAALAAHGNTLLGALSAALLGAGGSVVAAVFIAHLVADSFGGFDVTEAIDSLQGQSAMVRRQQSILITIEERDGIVHVTADHGFVAKALMQGKVPLSLSSSLGRWAQDGGIDRITVPAHPDGIEFSERVDRVPDAVVFSGEAKMRLRSSGEFRLDDGFSWTIDHVSRDLYVRIECRPPIAPHLTVDIHHHRADDIRQRIDDVTLPRNGTRTVEIDFPRGLLPYQGFEVHWDAGRPGAPPASRRGGGR